MSNSVTVAPGFSRSLAIVSGDKGDGRTYLAANLAICLALLGKRVVLIEADLESPRLAQLFDMVSEQPGLQQVLRGLAPLRSALSVFQTVPNLHVLSADPDTEFAGGLLHQAAMSVLIRSLRTEYDMVLVDTPACKQSADAMAVAMECGMAMLVARTGQSQISDLKALTARLQQSGVAVCGVVMNAH
jgi:protein-tyrosine kinase